MDSSFAALLFAAFICGVAVFGAVAWLVARARRMAQHDATLSHAAIVMREAQLARAQRIGNMGSWSWDAASDQVYWSAQTYVLLGLEANSVKPSFKAFIQRVYPDDAEVLKEGLRVAVEKQSTFEMQYRLIRPDGEVRTVFEQGEVERDGKGRVIRIFGTTLDVTERERLRQESADKSRMMQDVMDSLFSFIGVLDCQGVVLDANRAAVEGLGIVRDGVVGKPIWETVHWSHSVQTQQAARNAVARAARGEVVRFDQELRASSGNKIIVDVIFGPLRDASGRVTRIVGSGIDVTARKRAEEEAKAGKARLRALVDSVPECVKRIAQDGRILEINPAGAHMAEVDNPAALVGTDIVSLLEPQYRELYRAGIAAVFRGETSEMQYELIGAKGTRRWVEQHAVPLFDPDHPGRVREMLGVTRDITERALKDRALKEGARRLEEAQRIANVGSWEWDLVTNGLVWSDQTFRIFGQDPQVAQPTPQMLLQLSHPDDKDMAQAAIVKALRERAPYELLHRIVRPDGEVRVLREQGEVQVASDGRPLRFIGTTQDVTELRAAEAELMEAKLRAESANEAKSRFISNMSHELRTPLNAIIGFSSLMLHGTMDEQLEGKFREYAQDIHDSGEHLLKVINDILDISRVEIGKTTLNEEDVEIDDIVGATVRMVQTRADEAGVTLTVELRPNLPRLRADRRLLLQVLLNLTSNAVKFTEAGGEVAIDTRDAADGGFELIVHDTGIGMSAEDLERIGEPFVQIDNRLSRKYDGSGLGIVITKRLIHLHDGTLDIASVAGKGTTMTVRLPATRVLAPARAKTA